MNVQRLKTLVFACSIFVCLCPLPRVVLADVRSASFDLVAIQDQDTLETTVIADWHLPPNLPDVKLKLMEITVCEWWPGQKVRIPVTLCAPASGPVCEHLILANMGLAPKVTAPSDAALRLLREHHVGVVLAGMGTLDAMEPKDQLHLGMKKQLLQTKDARYTAAWIWGMSDMRALTAAMAEKSVFRPSKVLATGGSKRGVGAAICGIHDPRFTAILPVVAPILRNPGGVFVRGSDLLDEHEMNSAFMAQLPPGPNPLGLPDTTREALLNREQNRIDQSISREEALAAGWSEQEIQKMNDEAWKACRVVDHLQAVRSRGLEYFYHVGTNDNVCPGLLELGQQYPDFPIYILPGGQHGGPKTTGFTLQTPTQPEVSENLYYFARHHFFDLGSIPASPSVRVTLDERRARLKVEVKTAETAAHRTNRLFWCENRQPPYTFAAEYDQWREVPLTESTDHLLQAEIAIPASAKTIDIVSLHQSAQDDLPFHYSSPYTRWSR